MMVPSTTETWPFARVVADDDVTTTGGGVDRDAESETDVLALGKTVHTEAKNVRVLEVVVIWIVETTGIVMVLVLPATVEVMVVGVGEHPGNEINPHSSFVMVVVVGSSVDRLSVNEVVTESEMPKLVVVAVGVVKHEVDMRGCALMRTAHARTQSR